MLLLDDLLVIKSFMLCCAMLVQRSGLKPDAVIASSVFWDLLQARQRGCTQ
jgi:hypothetical protein